MADMGHDATAHVSAAEQGEMELPHAHSFVTRYIFSQDAKTIAIQYATVAIGIGFVALLLSILIRLQLGFPNTFQLIDPSSYLQYVTMHGMIMVVYLLTALFLGGFGQCLSVNCQKCLIG